MASITAMKPDYRKTVNYRQTCEDIASGAYPSLALTRMFQSPLLSGCTHPSPVHPRKI